MPFLSNVFPEQKQDVFDITDPANGWTEATGATQPGGGESFTPEMAETTIVVETTQNKRRSMLRRVLGFSCVADIDGHGNPLPVADQFIHRENPVRYPWLPNALIASSVSFSSFPPSGLAVTALSAQKNSSPFVNNAPPFYAGYIKTYATVKFSTPKEMFLSDDDEFLFLPDDVYNPAQEIYRNVYWEQSSSVEMLSAEGAKGQMRWAEGPGAPGGPPTLGQPGNVIPQAFGTLVSKSVYIMTWTRVPHEWISSEDFPLVSFDNLNAAIGRVNELPFGPGGIFPPGTILMQPPRLIGPYRWPVLTRDGVNVFTHWTVQVPFQYFNPPKTVNVTGPFLGFRTLPWSVDGNFYGAVRKVGAAFLLPEIDLSIIFDNVRV